ncbi:hypothetical protein BOTBODRAFT_30664 [Botryobasidium botryosum FD-172 SS1]|uniref:SNF5-domain-containing protein n=1 Tax=Botryobasidium botryosum (strain FD-172 SS1) TaxID=930990 RepID=A0A067MYZ3_BOTB1|nr:hypothetical protein BOTBODRAFT_30664 [Botryobasidium botryosum FD-172 SS1]
MNTQEYKSTLASMSNDAFSQNLSELQRAAKNPAVLNLRQSGTPYASVPGTPKAQGVNSALPFHQQGSATPGWPNAAGSPAPAASSSRSRSSRRTRPAATPVQAAPPPPAALPPNAYYAQPKPQAQAQYYQPGAAGSASTVPTHSQTHAQPHAHVPPQPSHLARPVIPTTPQALSTTYASRLRTGATLLVQPIISAAHNPGAGGTKKRVNYAEGSGDEDESDDSDYVGGRAPRRGTPRGQNQKVGSSTPVPQVGKQGAELDKSYLGMVPPSRFIHTKAAMKTKYEYIPQDKIDQAARRPEVLIPIKIDIDTETHRIRDSFVWNLNEDTITPDMFARTLCQDIDIPTHPYAEQIATSIRAQLEENAGVAGFDVREGDDVDVDSGVDEKGEIKEDPDCRVILALDVQIGTYHLIDHIEWDLSPPSSSLKPVVTPESFARHLCADLGLTGEAAPLIAHAMHEEILRHKRDAIEWGVLGGDQRRKGSKVLKGVWRDWVEAKEYGPRLEVLSAEEMEKREMERERAARRLRRDTSRFQKTTTRRRR